MACPCEGPAIEIACTSNMFRESLCRFPEVCPLHPVQSLDKLVRVSIKLRAVCVRYFPPFTSKLGGFIPIEFPVHDPERFIQLPSAAGLFEDEEYYGEQRLAGVNPVMLRGLESDDPRAAIVAAIPGAKAAISEGVIRDPPRNDSHTHTL